MMHGGHCHVCVAWCTALHDFWAQVAIAGLLYALAFYGFHICEADGAVCDVPCLDCGAGL